MISPDAYAELRLPDQHLEDWMQEVESAWIVDATKDNYHVLDLGYGSGIVAKALAKDHLVTVVDGAIDFCAEAAKIHRVQVVHSMFEDFQPLITKYDCVIASFILEHIADPVTLLKRARQWSDKLIVVVGNANSYHRQIAVKMGLQSYLDSLSERDVTVGHVRVYSRGTIYQDLLDAGWVPHSERGLGLKCLPNAMLAKLPPEVARTMIQIECDPECAANLMLVCVPEC